MRKGGMAGFVRGDRCYAIGAIGGEGDTRIYRSAHLGELTRRARPAAVLAGAAAALLLLWRLCRLCGRR